jgi:hypothetical protein
MGDLPLRGLKLGGGSQPELIEQDAGNRITVRVLRHLQPPVTRDRPPVQLDRADLPLCCYNLQAGGCHRHHWVKPLTRRGLRQPCPGVLLWTSPAGLTWTSAPEPQVG